MNVYVNLDNIVRNMGRELVTQSWYVLPTEKIKDTRKSSSPLYTHNIVAS